MDVMTRLAAISLHFIECVIRLVATVRSRRWKRPASFSCSSSTAGFMASVIHRCAAWLSGDDPAIARNACICHSRMFVTSGISNK
eukprot:5232259-Pyramimonas_sp.AAC.1